MATPFKKDRQYYKFCLYGFLKNQRFFEPFFILFFLQAGLDFLLIGILYSIREIAVNILEIPSGIVADSVGRKKSMVFSFTSYILSFLVFFFASSFWFFVIAMLLFSFGDAFRTGTHKAMIFSYVHLKGWNKYKAHYYGHTRSCSQLGSAVSSLLAAIIVIYTKSYNYIFLFAIIPYFFDLLLMTTYPDEIDGEKQKLHFKEIRLVFLQHLKTFIYSLKNANIWRSTANLSIFGGYYKAVKDYVQPVIQTFALSMPLFLGLVNKQRVALMVGIVYALIYLLTTLASRNSGKISEKFINHEKPLNFSLFIGFITGVLSGLFFNVEIFWVVIFLFVLIFLVENIRKPIGLAYYTEILDKKIYATALSFEAQFRTLITAVLAPLLGFFADLWGVGYALGIISGLMIMLLPLVSLKSAKNE